MIAKAKADAIDQKPFRLTIESPLGLSFDQDEQGFYVVTKVIPGGNTSATGKVKAGYRILEIEGASLDGVDKPAAISMIKDVSGVNGKCTLLLLVGTLQKVRGSQKGSFKAAGTPPVEYGAPFMLTVPAPLGMSFDQDALGRYVVKKITPGGNVEATGKVKVGYQILEVERTVTFSLDKPTVTNLIEKASKQFKSCTLKLKSG